MRHLVTGGSGFLGNLIARRLLERGEDVTVLDIWEDPTRPREIQFINADICNREAVARAMQDIDIVHHNVALVPLTKSGGKYWQVNVEGSRIAAEEAARAGVKSFIHMSSSAIFGIPEKCPITAETPTNPAEIYGRGKLAGELAVRKIAEKSGMKLVVIRPRTILGHGRLGIFQILFKWINEGRTIWIIGPGTGGFQFVHANDLMDAYMIALDRDKPGVYNVGTNRFCSLRESLENLIRHSGSQSKVKSLPAGLTINTLRILDYMRLSPLAPWHYLTYHKPFFFDMKPLEELGWNAQYSNDEMLAESYDWFLAHKDDPSSASDAASPHRKPVAEGILKLIRKIS
ncbi:MAG: NAD-dependent epimerase/dehydratase family protein [bacterium]